MGILQHRTRALFNPELYHGWGKTRNYFEGWYFKVVDPSNHLAYAIIPGIAMDEEGTCQVFIQILDGIHSKSTYHLFDKEAFRADSLNFCVQIAENRFSLKQIQLQVPPFLAELTFYNLTPWPKPGVMGPFTFVPFMECYHGVVSMHHRVSGKIQIGEKVIQLENAKGYIEKDWGRSFPKSWIWMQSNHFEEDENASFMFSLAHIPWMGSFFNGFLCGLYFDGKLHRFATYTGASIRGLNSGDNAEIILQNGAYRLEIYAQRNQGGDLKAPFKGKMQTKVNESLMSKIYLTLYHRGRLTFRGEGKYAGMEFSGQISQLFKKNHQQPKNQ